MHSSIKAGVLPFYLELYDEILPELRDRIEGFYNKIVDALENKGVNVTTVPICRTAREFASALETLETAGVSAVVTLHLAYSPSLESIEALRATKLPLVILDTTPTFSFTPEQDPTEIMFNHGIHGVQDMCNLLLRNNKKFIIEAGHWEHSDVIERVVSGIKAACLSQTMQAARIGIIGEPFRGMGDFFLPAEDLKRLLGIEVITCEPEQYTSFVKEVSEQEIDEERKRDEERFDCSAVDESVLERSLKTGLAIRKWMKQHDLIGFTFNFRDITQQDGFETVPFLEASKQMAEGHGYAGEGDCLTTALVSTVARIFPETSFTEMFCPDWENNTIFLSHMGEINYRLISERPVLAEMEYSFSNTNNPAYVPGRFKPGKVVLFDIAPTGEGFRLILTPAEMLPVEGEDKFSGSIRGWVRPGPELPDFLEQYSRYGGTHHLGVSYDCPLEVLARFAYFMGWDVKIIE